MPVAMLSSSLITEPKRYGRFNALDIDPYPNASVFLSEGSITSAASISFDNVFSSTYDNYMIVASGIANGSAQTLAMRLRANGSDNSDTQYIRQTYIASSSVSSSRGTSTTSWNGVGFFETTQRNGIVIYLFDPAKNSTTSGFSELLYAPQDMAGYYFNHFVGVSYDGFTLFSTSLTMNVRVYGFVNGES